jgi:pimeloyl-ACP methyl ester carboxylesterase/uncharacterized protein YjbJ (UPF0337 family)
VSSNYFERLALELNEFGPVIALDLPGFGGVPHPRGRRMSIIDYADLVGHVIDELGLDDPILIGHSMGTQIVAELGARYRRAGGEELSDLVLIGPVINRHERRLHTAALRFLQAGMREPPKVAILAIYAYVLCGPRWFSRVLPEMMAYRIENVLPRLNSEVLVLTGELDRLCPRYWAQEVSELLPRARVWEIAGAAHSVMHANAEDVARLCVRHARGEQPDDDRIRTVTHPREEEPAPPDVATGVKELKGRVTELIGIVTDNDETIAEGKSEHAEAEQRAEQSAAHSDQQ